MAFIFIQDVIDHLFLAITDQIVALRAFKEITFQTIVITFGSFTT